MVKKQQFITDELKNPKMKPEDIDIISDDMDVRDFGIHNIGNEKEESPFKDLKTMVNKENIDVKTILNGKQMEMGHRINVFTKVLKNEKNDNDAQEAAELLDYFTERMFELKVNKDGLSRKQFIQIVGEGEKKIQESQNAKLQKMLNL